MKEHKILLAILVLILILSTYWITNARAEDWQGISRGRQDVGTSSEIAGSTSFNPRRGVG